jgi:hypothetical protein
MDSAVMDRVSIASAVFPDKPGVYVVYESMTAARPLYVGKAQSQSLRKRWQQNHLKNRSGSSALRRSFAVHRSFVAEKLRLPERYYAVDVEQAVSDALKDCFVELFPMEWGEDIDSAERAKIRELDPILNVLR